MREGNKKTNGCQEKTKSEKKRMKEKDSQKRKNGKKLNRESKRKIKR